MDISLPDVVALVISRLIAAQNEYCELQFCINKQSAEATVMLVAE